MPQILSRLALASVVALAGCASTPADKGTASPTPSSSTSAPAASEGHMGTPVAIPAASAHRVVVMVTGSKEMTESKDWNELKREFRETFAEHAKDAGIAYEFVEAAPAGGQDGTVVAITVNDYRLVGIGARLLFGVMTGNAFIDAKVQLRNLRDGTVFGEQAYNTSSSAWGGIFAKMTPQQVDAIGHDIFLNLKSAR